MLNLYKLYWTLCHARFYRQGLCADFAKRSQALTPAPLCRQRGGLPSAFTFTPAPTNGGRSTSTAQQCLRASVQRPYVARRDEWRVAPSTSRCEWREAPSTSQRGEPVRNLLSVPVNQRRDEPCIPNAPRRCAMGLQYAVVKMRRWRTRQMCVRNA